MPLTGEDGKDFRGDYCTYCTDESGNLKDKSEIRKGIAEWLAIFSPDPRADFMKRAEHYMAAMPEWAQE
jgi:hypothetical protein